MTFNLTPLQLLPTLFSLLFTVWYVMCVCTYVLAFPLHYSLSPTDAKLATCSDDGTVRIFDFIRCSEEFILRGKIYSDCQLSRKRERGLCCQLKLTAADFVETHVIKLSLRPSLSLVFDFLYKWLKTGCRRRPGTGAFQPTLSAKILEGLSL